MAVLAVLDPHRESCGLFADTVRPTIHHGVDTPQYGDDPTDPQTYLNGPCEGPQQVPNEAPVGSSGRSVVRLAWRHVTFALSQR
jgi:hypothetical protein